ncbi:MAG: hypothetical protein HQ517_01030 [SAR324 cluster bacterium]|nr:hypothetical protein [SAR324 cluster bacterium]
MKFELMKKLKSFNNSRHNQQTPPKDLPQPLGSYLVVNRSMNPDEVWKWKCVIRPRAIKNQYDFRIFNPVAAKNKNVRVMGFDSLDAHPDLILHQGWHDKHENQTTFDLETDNHAA